MTSEHRATRPVPQRGAEWLDSASTEAIAEAFVAGGLAEVLGGPVPVEVIPGVPWMSSDLAAATPVQVAATRDRGDLRALLAGEDGQQGGVEAA